MKIANVIPISKTGDRKILSNYRPISILLLISKDFEKCMYKRIIKIFPRFNIISDKQYGFQSGKPCADAVGQLLDFVYLAINDKKYLISIFFGSKKGLWHCEPQNITW